MCPIKGLTENIRFERIGKIHLGVKAVNERGVSYPQAVDYFVCDNPAFCAVYGDKPRILEICFPVNEPGLFASQYYRAYSHSRGLICKGDGERCNRLINSKTGETTLLYKEEGVKETAWAELSCPGRECEHYQTKKCREIMFLQFFLPRVAGLGIWQLDTSSINSIRNVNSAVELLRLALNGNIAFAPLKLSIVPREVTPEGRKKTVHVLQLELPNIKMRLADLSPYAMLPPSEDETPELLFPTEAERQAQVEAEGDQPEEAMSFTASTLPAPEITPSEAAPIEEPHGDPILIELVDICQRLGLVNAPQAIQKVAALKYQRDWQALTTPEKQSVLADAKRKLKTKLDNQAAKEDLVIT